MPLYTFLHNVLNVLVQITIHICIYISDGAALSNPFIQKGAACGLSQGGRTKRSLCSSSRRRELGLRSTGEHGGKGSGASNSEVKSAWSYNFLPQYAVIALHLLQTLEQFTYN
jgi:hypothetical protein